MASMILYLLTGYRTSRTYISRCLFYKVYSKPLKRHDISHPFLDGLKFSL